MITCIICGVKQCAKSLCRKHYGIMYRTKYTEKVRTATNIWRKNNPEKVKKQAKEWNINNYKRRQIMNRTWTKKNKIRDLWRKNNPERVLKWSIKHLEKNCILFNLTTVEYKYALNSWSKTIRKRDENKCQMCGSKENLNAHHIIYKSNYPQLSLNINNGITLCRYCHYETHGFVRL